MIKSHAFLLDQESLQFPELNIFDIQPFFEIDKRRAWRTIQRGYLGVVKGVSTVCIKNVYNIVKMTHNQNFSIRLCK